MFTIETGRERKGIPSQDPESLPRNLWGPIAASQLEAKPQRESPPPTAQPEPVPRGGVDSVLLCVLLGTAAAE